MYLTATDKRRALQKLVETGVNGTVDRRIQGDFGSSVAVNSQGIGILSSASPIALPDWQEIGHGRLGTIRRHLDRIHKMLTVRTELLEALISLQPLDRTALANSSAVNWLPDRC